MASKLKIDDLNLSNALDREAMRQVFGGGQPGQQIPACPHLKRRFRDNGGRGWTTRFRTGTR